MHLDPECISDVLQAVDADAAVVGLGCDAGSGRGMWCLRSSGRVPQYAGDDLAVQDRYGWPDDLGDPSVVADVCGLRDACGLNPEDEAGGEEPRARFDREEVG